MAEEFPDARIELIESGGGVFEVTLDGELIFSKKSLNRHAEAGEVAGLVRRSETREGGSGT